MDNVDGALFSGEERSGQAGRGILRGGREREPTIGTRARACVLPLCCFFLKGAQQRAGGEVDSTDGRERGEDRGSARGFQRVGWGLEEVFSRSPSGHHLPETPQEEVARWIQKHIHRIGSICTSIGTVGEMFPTSPCWRARSDHGDVRRHARHAVEIQECAFSLFEIYV